MLVLVQNETTKRRVKKIAKLEFGMRLGSLVVGELNRGRISGGWLPFAPREAMQHTCATSEWVSKEETLSDDGGGVPVGSTRAWRRTGSPQ